LGSRPGTARGPRSSQSACATRSGCRRRRWSSSRSTIRSTSPKARSGSAPKPSRR